MKKPLWDITLAQAGELIKCKDDNGEWMCSKGCPFRVTIDNISCCHKNVFYGMFFRYFNEQGLLSESDDRWEIELK